MHYQDEGTSQVGLLLTQLRWHVLYYRPPDNQSHDGQNIVFGLCPCCSANINIVQFATCHNSACGVTVAQWLLVIWKCLTAITQSTPFDKCMVPLTI